MQADISAAVAWTFTQFTHPELASASDYPKLAACTARAEALPAFASTPLE
jgi:glutathione S-transferase